MSRYFNKKILEHQDHLQTSGVPLAFGIYKGLIRQVSTRIWDGKAGVFSARRTIRKTWIFISAHNKEWVMSFAIVDAGLIAKAFVYAYNLKTKELWEDGITIPMGMPKLFDPNICSHWQLKNYKIETTDDIMHVSYKGKFFCLNMFVELNVEQGLSFVCPSRNNRPFHFTYKNLLLKTKVRFESRNGSVELDDLQAGIDFSKGYPPRDTFWNFTSFMGKTDDGAAIGINLVNGFNNNMENAIWLENGEHQLVGNVVYSYKPPLKTNTWNVESVDGNLQLQLFPKGTRVEQVNAVALKNKFIQVYGPMQGQIKKGEHFTQITGHGLMEEHHALW